MRFLQTIVFSSIFFSLLQADQIKQEKLTLGFMPYLSAEVLLKKYTPLANYLSKELDIKVEIVIAKNYTKHIEDTGKDKLDISFLGGSPYVVITNKYGKKPLLVRYEFNGKPTFGSVIFVSRNSPIKTLDDLKDKSFAFGNAKSTLSTQVPLYMLMNSGITLDSLSSYSHLKNHENVIYGVAYDDFNAGSVAQEVFNEKKYEGIRLLKSSPEVSTHVFVTRSNLSKELQVKIKNALLKLKTIPSKSFILKNISKSLTGFVEVKDSDYDYHRDMLKKVIPELNKGK
ncbi:phosphate/phosphite/phosphonate ABC transporter substrate-binding protein [Arcobacteraceae bacterium]|nr:phosphate/phosphite/phosphonate ABC transporter substrate-binding protein [Arcobacteraceae bacterium]